MLAVATSKLCLWLAVGLVVLICIAIAITSGGDDDDPNAWIH